MRHSIQWRLQLWHGVILACALAASGYLAWRAAWQEELRRLDGELGSALALTLRAPEGFRRMGPPPDDRKKKGPPPADNPMVDSIKAEITRNIWQLEREQDPANYYVFLERDGTVLARTSNAPAGVPLPGGARIPPDDESRTMIPGQLAAGWQARSRAGNREVYRILPLGDAIIAGRPFEALRDELVRRLWWLVPAAAGLLSLGLVGGWWFTRRALEPIRAVSRTAAEIVAGDLTRRIQAVAGDRELSQMIGVLNDSFDRLQNAVETQARFTADASHELRTPVTVILTKAQSMLQRERTVTEYQEALRICARAAQRMRTLTSSLLTLTRLDAGVETLERRPLDLAQAATEALDLLEPLAAEKGVALVRRLEAAPLEGNADEMTQVVTNLVVNAIQHTPAGGTITVTTGAPPASLEVRDTGPGIAREDLPRLFDRFYRADKARGSQGGSGLGLAIARGIVERHGGRIEAENAPAGGAIFRVISNIGG